MTCRKFKCTTQRIFTYVHSTPIKIQNFSSHPEISPAPFSHYPGFHHHRLALSGFEMQHKVVEKSTTSFRHLCIHKVLGSAPSLPYLELHTNIWSRGRGT